MKDLIGKHVKIKHYSKWKDGSYVLREVEEGVVQNCYPHHFSVKIANRIECFRYNELTGNETTQVKVKK